MKQFGSDVLERRERVNAGVVHQDVDLVVRFLGLGEELVDLFRLGEIRLQRDRLPALFLDVGDHLVGPFLAG